jgi:hypothetical protein
MQPTQNISIAPYNHIGDFLKPELIQYIARAWNVRGMALLFGFLGDPIEKSWAEWFWGVMTFPEAEFIIKQAYNCTQVKASLLVFNPDVRHQFLTISFVVVVVDNIVHVCFWFFY